MLEVVFLIVLALIWIVFASVQDLREREVANWLNFSLIIFALGFRFFYSLFEGGSYDFFYQGLIGLGIFFILGNALYYGKMFAGGDAKLMIALGAVIGFSESFSVNLKIYILFLLVFLFSGALYGLSWSLFLAVKNFKNFKEEFRKQVKKNLKLFYFAMIVGLCFMGIGFFENLFFLLGVFIFVSPYFYLFAKSVDEVCMVKKVKVKDLREGDWLYKNVKVGSAVIKANWEGLSKKDIELIRKKNKFVLIRQGIPFIPVFLISFLIFLWVFSSGVWSYYF